MPNLVGLREISSPSPSMGDQAKLDLLNAMQMEALGIDRREDLSTTDFKENRASYIATMNLESQRLVNKSSISRREQSILEGWNNAWTRLQGDGTDSQKLQDVNEGLGQTHRAKLMRDDSVRDYTGESNFRGGGRGSRVRRLDHAGRSGSSAGRGTGRGGGAKAKGDRRVTFQTASHQPITRVRVPKRHLATAQPDVPPRQPLHTPMTVSAVKPVKGPVNTPSVRFTSIQRPIVLAAPSAFMASVNTGREHSRRESNTNVAFSDTSTSEQAAEHNLGTSIQITTNPSNEKVTAHMSHTSDIEIPKVTTTVAADKPFTSVSSHPKADLMDLDIGQETMQPVLQFTTPGVREQPCHRVEEVFSFDQRSLEVLVKKGVISATQLEDVKTIQTLVHACRNPLTPVEEAPRQVTYIRPELKSSSPAAAAVKVTTGIARKFAEQQNAFLIGEHVHKTRYHTAASLTEDFEKLSISNKESVNPAAPSLTTTERSSLATATETSSLTITEKSKVNPFGPSLAKRKGPSLPVHLLSQIDSTDPGAAARVQYSGGHNTLAQISDRQALGNLTAPQRVARRNKINETGFIALAENRGNDTAGKKGRDPLLVAHKGGL